MPEQPLSRRPEALLQVRDLSVDFSQGDSTVHAVREISFDVHEGEFFGIVGESGSGKSVSSMAVMGLLPASARISGDITFDGQSLLDRSDKKMSRLRGSEISMVFQDPLSALTPVYTIGDQIAEALTLHDRSLSKHAAHSRAVELLTTVGIPAPERRAQGFPHEFSGGMRQRVMIAMAIANDPKLIIADEPTTALDVTIQAQILELLQQAKDITGAAVVLVTHDLGVVAGNADRIGVMYAGRFVETGNVRDVFERSQMPYTIGLLRSVPNPTSDSRERLVPLEGRPPPLSDLPPGCPFEPRCPLAVDSCREAEPPLDEHEPGHAAACIRAPELIAGAIKAEEVFPRPEPVSDAERFDARASRQILRLDDLKRYFPLLKGAMFKKQIGTVKAVDGISLDVGEGQAVGLVGESGCGKSTTLLEILELAQPQSGTIEVDGTDVAALDKKSRLAMRSDIQVVFQDPMASLDPRLTVEDIIAEPLEVHGESRQVQYDRVRDLLDDVGLEAEMASRYPHEFSGGQRQRIGIARALATEPKLLVLDEPVSSLDVSIQAGVINLLENLRTRLGLSYLFVAHDLAVVRQLVDKVAVMYLGRIVEAGAVDKVFGEPRHPYTQALMSAAPVPDPDYERARDRILLEGDLPSPSDDISGCSFHSRCPLYKILDLEKQERCRTDDPGLRVVGESDVACHWAENLGQGTEDNRSEMT